MKILPVGAEL